MKAVVYHRYGGPEVLHYAEVPELSPGPGQVLVKLKTAALNAVDRRLMRADPFLVRLHAGLFRPRQGTILGSDFAGVVAAVGPGVSSYAIGDAVFGNSFDQGLSALAEYVCVGENALAHKPASVGFAEAAATPLAGITALQALRDLAAVRPGDAVLIQGAGGGVGGFAVQIAKALGADVTAVCGAGSTSLAREQGADRVLDYATTDFAREDLRYDVILGVNGYRSLGDYKRSLKPGGRYVMVGGEIRQFFEALLLGWLRFRGGDKSIGVLTIDDSRRAGDLVCLRDMLAARQLRPSIARSFGVAETRKAMAYLEEAHVQGKVVLRLEPLEEDTTTLACSQSVPVNAARRFTKSNPGPDDLARALPRLLPALLMLALCFCMGACTITSQTAGGSQLGVPLEPDRLEVTLTKPGSVELTTVVAGEWSIPLGGLIDLEAATARSAGLVDVEVRQPLVFHVLRHPTEGTYLINSGATAGWAGKNGEPALSEFARHVMRETHRLTVQTPTSAWLARHGDDVRGVLLTGLHFYELLGLPDLPAGIPVFMGPGEVGYRTGLTALKFRSSYDRLLARTGPLQEWQFPLPSGGLPPMIDVFGDASVVAIWLPGMTPGNTAYLVRTPQGPVLLAGSTSHTPWSWEHCVGPGEFAYDGAKAAESLWALRAIAERFPALRVFPPNQAQ